MSSVERESLTSSDFLEPTDPRWNGFLADVGHDFYHLPDYVAARAMQSGGTASAFLYEEGDSRVFVPFILRPTPSFGEDALKGWHDASSPYGYPGPITVSHGGPNARGLTGRSIAALLVSMRERGVLTAFVRMHPMLSSDLPAFAGRGDLVLHGRTVAIDLRLSAAERWSQMRANHRTGIRRLTRAGFAVELDPDWKSLGVYLDVYRQTMDRVGADHNYRFIDEYYTGLRAVRGGSAHLFVVKTPDGAVAAAAIFLETRGIVQYHLGGTRDDCLQYHPHKLLYHEVAGWAAARGNHILHLGGGVGGREDSLFHFKAGFSNTRFPFYTWRACSVPPIYAKLAARCAGNDGSFFPPWRAHSLPPTSIESLG